MAQHDDPLTGAVPEPETEPTAAERAHARRFAELVDKTLAGRTPPAISADDRALLEVATVIRAASGEVALPASRQRAVVDQALQRAIGAPRPVAVPSVPQRWPRVPWLITAATTLVAAAAVVVLWLRAPAQPQAQLPAEWRSRPADALIGPIARDHAGDASARLDAIFADRLDGFRARQLARGGRP